MASETETHDVFSEWLRAGESCGTGIVSSQFAQIVDKCIEDAAAAEAKNAQLLAEIATLKTQQAELQKLKDWCMRLVHGRENVTAIEPFGGVRELNGEEMIQGMQHLMQHQRNKEDKSFWMGHTQGCEETLAEQGADDA